MFLDLRVYPQGSVLVMTDADCAGIIKDGRSYSGIAVWAKGTVEDTWCTVYTCLSSGESELMALVGCTCEGIATRD